jgi:hypothetical protein
MLPLISMPSCGNIPHPESVNDRPLLSEMLGNSLSKSLFV